MLRITETEDRAQTLHIEGRLVGPWVDELRRACQQASAGADMTIIDLADVDFADQGGLTLLIALRDEGIPLINCSPFLRAQLRVAP